MERLVRSVRDFVQPLVPRGSLEAGGSYSLDEDAAAQGTRLHGRIQKRLACEHPQLEAERSLAWTYEAEGFACLVRGRADVFIPGREPIVEEIKTTLRLQALLRALAADPEHPFLQQVRMYAFMLAADGERVPQCRLRVASLLDETEAVLEVALDLEAFGAWVEAQGRGLHRQHQRALARRAERRRIGEDLAFPFPAPRSGQERLQAQVEASLAAGSRLLVQAPTGLGKTAAVLFPALRKALTEDLRVFYLTPRNSQHGVAEAFVRRLLEAGHPVRAVTLRAKEKVCPQPVLHCHPDACPRALGHYDRLAGSAALDHLEALGCADTETLQRVADAHQLCPFELALDAACGADVIIGDYNYALAPGVGLARFFGDQAAQARNLLCVDEAHNLPERAAAWFSPALDLAELALLGRGWKGRRVGLKGRFLRQLDRCIGRVAGCAGEHREVEVDAEAFQEEELRLRTLLAQAAAEGQELAPGHPLVQLYRGWTDFCEGLRGRTDAHLLTWVPPGRLQITCVDASAHLAARFAAAAGAVLFSATLKPFPYQARRCGLEDPRCEEVGSPFPAANRRLLLVPQISTRYRRREREAPRIAAFLERVLPLRPGNYLVFFPSFEFLERTRPLLELPGFQVLAQPRRAGAGELQGLLRRLESERGLVVLAVQGGSLAEGIDLPGEALIGCVVVGPPLPPHDLEQRLARAYFDRRGEDGEAFTSTYPAMAKAIQAAGRVIRGPEDRGLLAFLDDRFLHPDFAACFPVDWFAASPREAVSHGILADVAAFWSGP